MALYAQSKSLFILILNTMQSFSYSKNLYEWNSSEKDSKDDPKTWKSFVINNH